LHFYRQSVVSRLLERVLDGQSTCGPLILAGSGGFKKIGILTAKENSYPSFPPLRADFFSSFILDVLVGAEESK